MLTFNVEVVLKGRDYALTESVTVPHGDPASWTEGAVRDVLVEMLRAIDRAQNPDATPDRPIVLQGFSWIVEPVERQVMIALEIPSGAAVAGPFDTSQDRLDATISRVLRQERELAGRSQTIH